MKRIVRLTESDLTRIVRRTIEEKNIINEGDFMIDLERVKREIKSWVEGKDSTYTTKGDNPAKELEDAYNWLIKQAKEIKKSIDAGGGLKKVN